MEKNPVSDIRSFDLPNPFKPRSLYAFRICVGYGELMETIAEINRCGYCLISVTRQRDVYTVFFRRTCT